MSAETINTIIIVSFAVIAGLGFLRGYFKGVYKTGIDLLFTILGLVISILVTKGISSLVITKEVCQNIINGLKGVFTDANVQEYLDMFLGYLENPNVTDTVNIAVAIPTIVLSPIIFIVVLLIVGAILKIPRFALEWLILPKAKDLAVKLSGGALCAIRYSVVLLFILVPLTGYLNYAATTVDTICQMEENGEASVLDTTAGIEASELKENDIVKAVYLVKDNPIIQMTYNLGGRPLFEILTTTNTCGVELNLGRETDAGLKIYGAIREFIDAKPIDYDQKQIDALNKISDALDDSEFITILASRLISFASGELLDNDKIAKFEKPDFTEHFNPTIDRILAVLEATDENSIKQDIKMITNIASSTIKHGVLKELLSETGDAFKVIENDRYLDEIFLELYRNERTRNALPYLSNSINNYLIELYNVINGTDEKPTEFDYDKYNEQGLNDESVRIVNTIKKFRQFVASTEKYKDDKQSLACYADLEAFGDAVEIARDSVLLGRSFNFFVYAFLHSEGCAELGIVDKYFIENATKPDADISSMLVARQTLIKLSLSMQSIGTDGAKHEMIESVIETMLSGDNAAIQQLITVDYLESIGVSKSNAGSINGIVNSVIDAASEQSFESEEQKHEEIVKTEIIINAISNSVVDDSSENMFSEGNNRGNSNMTATELVDRVADSSLVSSMVQKAVDDETGNTEDPYHIQENMSEKDINAITNAISDKYNNENATEKEKQTMEALATLFGVSIK